MSNVIRIKPILTAIARPGAGKTETLLAMLPSLINADKRFVLALPTIVLSDDIAERASKRSIPFRTIDHRTEEPVVPELETALREKKDSLIICTQESVRHVKHSLLRGWILVVDELPKVVDYPDYELKAAELPRVFDYTVERDGQLWIKDGLEELTQEQVDTYRADVGGTERSTLGHSAANIFRLLLCGVDVFIDKPQPNGKRHIRAVEEYFGWWKILSSADEAHVLAANIEGGEFETFAKVHGFTFSRSIFTPEPEAYKSSVTIYPLMPKGQIFSTRKMQEKHGSERLIDLALQTALGQTHTTPLLSANKWARFDRKRGVQFVPKDCRGLNSFDTATEAILLFGGNPSPSERLGLQYLSTKYGADFESAFITTRLLEASLQTVARTAIRRPDNTSPIRLFVQDERVAQYLVGTYLHDAVIDWSLSEVLPVKLDGRKRQHPQHAQVLGLLARQVPVKEIARQTQVTAKTIRSWRDELDAA